MVVVLTSPYMYGSAQDRVPVMPAAASQPASDSIQHVHDRVWQCLVRLHSGFCIVATACDLLVLTRHVGCFTYSLGPLL
jgi:hypothetical protein